MPILGAGRQGSAGALIFDWMRRAEASGIKLLKNFAHTVSAHRKGILAWYDDKISTGPLEGTNIKIKTISGKPMGIGIPKSSKR